MTPRDRTVVVVLATAAVIAALWFGIVGPRRAQLSDLRQQTAQAQTDRDAAVTQAAAGLAAKRAYAANLRVLADLGKAVPTSDDTAGLLYELQDAAGHSRVALTAITPSASAPGATTPPAPAVPAAAAAGVAPATTGVAPAAPAAAEAPQPVSMSLTFQGTYADLLRLLHRVESFTSVDGNKIAVHGRLVAVGSISLTTAPASTQITAALTATAYLAPAPPAAPATGAAPATPGSGSSTAPTAPAAVLGAGG